MGVRPFTNQANSVEPSRKLPVETGIIVAAEMDWESEPVSGAVLNESLQRDTHTINKTYCCSLLKRPKKGPSVSWTRGGQLRVLQVPGRNRRAEALPFPRLLLRSHRHGEHCTLHTCPLFELRDPPRFKYPVCRFKMIVCWNPNLSALGLPSPRCDSDHLLSQSRGLFFLASGST